MRELMPAAGSKAKIGMGGKPEVGDQKSEVKGQKSEVRNQKSKVRSQRLISDP
jgi:hypothetical protein